MGEVHFGSKILRGKPNSLYLLFLVLLIPKYSWAPYGLIVTSGQLLHISRRRRHSETSGKNLHGCNKYQRC